MNIRLLSMLCVSGSALAQSMPLPPVVDHSAYPAATAYSSKPSSTTTLYEILGRLEQLQAEVQQLRGSIEEQAYSITELKKRQNTIYSDLDQRLQVLESTSQHSSSSIAQPTSPTMAAPSTVERSHEPIKLGLAEGEKERYQQAYNKLKDGHYSSAITEFNALIKDYPNGNYSDNAQYWLGEAYKVNREISSSKDAFNKVINNYPNSSKVRDALLKLGYIEFDQGNRGKARDYLTKITVEYPGTTAAHLAAKKLQLIENSAP